ncbi:class I SAM-dependent methyltransferase [Roseixanthobacter pseudopolyaromaticivorans]|uniref:class I SAM-dependent methyltransferase n=1 Tax=Xanthobacteraceae TaxID=335928 RepID=UPI0037288364
MISDVWGAILVMRSGEAGGSNTLIDSEAAVEAALQKAKNSGFLAKAVTEYRRVSAWIGNQIDLNSASILDFGCGEGVPAVSFALRHPKAKVVGADIVATSLRNVTRSYRSEASLDIPANVTFETLADGRLTHTNNFDIIYSWSTFEHIKPDRIEPVSLQLREALKHDGLLFIQSSPLYFSPTGSHLYRYFSSPWHHLLLPLDEIRNGIISETAGDRELREWQQFLDLNRLTANQILSKIENCGLKLKRKQLFTSDIQPPTELLDIYSSDALITTGFQALFFKE